MVAGACLVPAQVRTVGCLLRTGTCAAQAQSGGMTDVNLNTTSGAGSVAVLLIAAPNVLATEVYA